METKCIWWACPWCGALGCTPGNADAPGAAEIVTKAHAKMSPGCEHKPMPLIDRKVVSDRVVLRFKPILRDGKRKKRAREETEATPRPSWKTVPADVIRKVVADMDGHTLFPPNALVAMGVPPELEARHTHIQYGRLDDPKSCMFDNDGYPMVETEMIYGLEVLDAIVDDLGLRKQLAPVLGRGFHASNCQQVILRCLDEANAQP